jgi:hypothetical protein
MSPVQLRRLYRAARTLDPARMAALQERYARAEATLRAALIAIPAWSLDVPGYKVFMQEGHATVAPRAITAAAQLALWRQMQADA